MDLQEYLESSHVRELQVDMGTADVYATIFADLRRKGRPIPTNDIWIAAHAMQHNLVLVTRDKHFGEINGLSVQSW